jgi:hypothetical protein
MIFAGLVSHTLDDVTLDRWAEFDASFNKTHKTVLVLTSELYRAASALGIRANIICRDDLFRKEYAKGSSRSIIPGNCDLIALAIARKWCGFDHYTVVEYDVFSPSGFSNLHAADMASDADLIVADVVPKSESPNWPHWKTIKVPVQADLYVSNTQVARYSARLIESLDRCYRGGWEGHAEALVPMIASMNGFKVETWNDAASRVALPELTNRKTFGWKEARPMSKTHLYHPVKYVRVADLIRHQAL